MDPVRVGVIGVGHLGYHHARVYASLPGARLVGVVDIDGDKRAKAAADFDTAGHEQVESLLNADIDAASVVVPTRAHRDVAERLLDAGIDVLVEKPIASTYDEAVSMVECAARCDRILQVGHIERFNGAVVALFNAVKQPRFIECHRLSPYPNRGDDVSVVLDLMIHDLDIVRALVGEEAVSVDAIGVPVFSQYEDIANARIRFTSGCVANITCSRVSLEKMRKIRIFSESAYVSTDFSAQDVLVYHKKPGPIPEGGTPMDMISVEPLDVLRDEPLKLELESFLACVRTRQRPVVAGEDALEALRLADRVMESIRGGT